MALISLSLLHVHGQQAPSHGYGERYKVSGESGVVSAAQGFLTFSVHPIFHIFDRLSYLRSERRQRLHFKYGR